ncbi:MAG: Spy/CpxP family protein refolding chaperone [Candidatus Aminicenantes bacterium]|nr:MAG: Spy/CpxP family protein refolding chaperone [Candidatus Aminicenantes bacterium]
MKKILTASLIFSLLALSVAVLFARPQQRMTRARRMVDRPQNRILGVLKANQEDLGITDDQIEQVQNLVFSFQERSLEMRHKSSLNRLELQKLMEDRENLDYDMIKAVLARTSADRNEMFIEGLKLREDISNVLTPEQREALKELGREGMRGRTRNLRGRFQQRSPRFRNRIRR